MIGQIELTLMEVVKNLTLKGLNELCIHVPSDAKEIQSSSAGSIFPYPIDELVTSATTLNPSVTIRKTDHISFDFNVIIACDYWNESSLLQVAKDCREKNVAFMSAFSSEMLGCLVTDFGDNYEYRFDTKKVLPDGSVETFVTPGSLKFATFKDSFSRTDAPILTLLKGQFSVDKAVGGLAPVSAITSALTAQEVIKVITRKDKPVLNLLTFDGETLDARMFF